jgi:histidine triad (HIT) family protein
MINSDDCVFCALFAGDTEASTVLRNERLMAAMTIRPEHVGHVLLFPAEHVEDFALLDEPRLGYLLSIAARLKTAISEAIPCEGFQLVINQGEATGQKKNCRHLHVHLIPRSSGARAPSGERPAEAPREELDAAARKIAERLNLDAL